MKIKLIIATCLLVLGAGLTQAASTLNFDRTSLTVTDENNRYEITSEFNVSKTRAVQSVLDDYLKGGASFKNATIDADMTLPDHTSFYIKLKPGKLVLKLDKRKNSAEVYERFKKMVVKIRAAIV